MRGEEKWAENESEKTSASSSAERADGETDESSVSACTRCTSHLPAFMGSFGFKV